MTVLTMAFLGIENRRDLPRVPYSTALDYFVGICFAFVLATILQFSGVHFFTKHGSGEVYIVPEDTSEDDSDGTECESEKVNICNINTHILASKIFINSEYIHTINRLSRSRDSHESGAHSESRFHICTT